MRKIIYTTLFTLICSFAYSQSTNGKWYSETVRNGVRIQNSFPKGGPYKGKVENGYNYSYLVFFTRIVNETDKQLDMTLHFSGDSIAIPGSPNTYVKLFLPPDKMTMDKQHEFSYGVTELQWLDQKTALDLSVRPNEDGLFYVVAVFYQTTAKAWEDERGGNRAELVLDGSDLYYRMKPQVDLMHCGTIDLK
ncbi:MAG: hypothetical protein AB8B56_00165 [Crocinitomicaceae bacterium]